MLAFSFDASHLKCAVTWEAHVDLRACLQINCCRLRTHTRTRSRTHAHTHTDTYTKGKHANTNMPHRQDVLQSLCVKGTDLCVKLYWRGLSASEHPETLG